MIPRAHDSQEISSANGVNTSVVESACLPDTIKIKEPMQSSNLPPGSLQLHNPLLNDCRSVYDSYERLDRLDEGTYGIVWKARDLATNEIVALKQIQFDMSLEKKDFPWRLCEKLEFFLLSLTNL